MPNIDGKEYPRLENGVVVEAPTEKAKPATVQASVDINAASSDDLKSLRGIGAKVARAIVAERENGLYKSLDDCAERVKGVTLDRLRGADVYIGSDD